MNDTCNFTGFTNNTIPPVHMDKLLKKCYGPSGLERPNGPDKNTEMSLKFLFYSLAAIANILLVFIMCKDPLKRFRNSTSYFICNLAIADLLSIASGISDTILQIKPDLLDTKKKGQEFAGCFAAIGVQCSFLVIMIFAIDRYMAIVYPYKYKSIMSKTFVLVTLILFPWCFAIVTLPIIYFYLPYERSLTDLFAGDIIALICITLIVHPLTHWHFKRKIKVLAESNSTSKLLMQENLKIAKVLTTTVLMVSLCLITFMSPYLAAFIISLADCTKCFLSHTFLSFWKFYPLLTAIRLLTNSLVYVWRLPLYRVSLKALLPKMFYHKWNRSSSNNRVQHSPNQNNVPRELNYIPHKGSELEKSSQTSSPNPLTGSTSNNAMTSQCDPNTSFAGNFNSSYASKE